MAKYKRNHHIPVFMLNYWASQSENYPYLGVWVYEIDSKRKYFANAQGRSAYAFAATNDVYVPTIEGERATGMERLFSSLEGTLAYFASQVHQHQETLILEKKEDIVKVLAALFALECRSPSIIQQFQDTFTSFDTTPQSNKTLSHQLALENVLNYMTERAARYSLGHMQVFYCKESRVLLSDRPMVGDPELTYKLFALTSKVIVALSEERLRNEFSYIYEEVEKEQVELNIFNKNIARQARMWIASTSESQLDQYIPVFDSDEWKEYRYSTKVKPMGEVQKGWKLMPDDMQYLRQFLSDEMGTLKRKWLESSIKACSQAIKIACGLGRRAFYIT